MIVLRFIYTILFYAIQPLILLKLLWRSRKTKGYRQRVLERYGFCAGKVQKNAIHLHSVSVGEFIAIVPFARALLKRYPNQPLLITTMTVTGSDLVQKTFANEPNIKHVYLPYDLPDAIARFLNAVQPRLSLIMETELWPNLIYALYQRQIPLIVANARLSARSANGYQKLNRFGNAMAQLLTRIPHLAAQHQSDGDRFLQLGLPPAQLSIMGTIKFDIQLTKQAQDRIAQLKATWQLQDRAVWIGASTHQDEDEILLKTQCDLLKSFPNLLFILVPRHPERFATVEALIQAEKLSFVRLSALKANPDPVDLAHVRVILGDTIGDLNTLYGLANVAFIGGSLIDRGGHNPLEAALHRLPILMGASQFNFTAVCAQLEQENALITVKSQTELETQLKSLLQDSQKAQQMGDRAALILKYNQGALDRLLGLVDKELKKQATS